MSVSHLCWRDALRVVRVGRKIANPNAGFQIQLQDFENNRVDEERRRMKERFPSLASELNPLINFVAVSCLSISHTQKFQFLNFFLFHVTKCSNLKSNWHSNQRFRTHTQDCAVSLRIERKRACDFLDCNIFPFILQFTRDVCMSFNLSNGNGEISIWGNFLEIHFHAFLTISFKFLLENLNQLILINQFNFFVKY